MSVYTRLVTETMMPISVIHRPLPSYLDEEKVLSLMETLKSTYSSSGSEEVPPIDVHYIKGKNNPSNNYYLSFGGCHRFEAHKRLGLPTIKARIVESTPDTIKVYLGSSTPEFL
ncbi:BEACH domain-containing protein [Heterostelium album PN500]|uniref:Sulfiredoxin n=1 Tax=Heterostelium pallidum (strain ATCC 26659 / Pp 5 / PN500) TaxID=670386 RepID=D3BQB1_HETP5|nr:BEACH domain-containing protein [Heterostelium album PN500]EFA76331.1 BEACH domain-containing protein [Heterostelium album PN500]|eukprot:XP_020428463.1 BEACH domain-containing protein [Heterostelium album PN500]